MRRSQIRWNLAAFLRRSRTALTLAFLLGASTFLIPSWSVSPPPPAEPAKPSSVQPLSEDGWDLIQRAFGIVLRDYVDPKTPDQVIRGALQGAAATAGPESAYIPPEEVEAFRKGEKTAFSLPLYVTKGDDFARIISVFPGLEKAPEPGDFLKSVNGISTYDSTYPRIISLLAGKSGEKAQCVFLKREAFETYRLTLPFLPLPAPSWTSRPKGGVLTLASLPAELPAALSTSLRDMQGGAILVDLRECAQGDPGAALITAGVLMGKAEGPTTRSQKGDVRHPLSGAGLLAGKKVRVLMGPRTARGGEVLALALETAGAMTLGETTFGWAPQWEVFPLNNGGLLRLNTAFFLDREGKPLKDHGLAPQVPLAPQAEESKEAFLDRALSAQPPTPPKEGASAEAKAGKKD